jgi:hypothetical protein
VPAKRPDKSKKVDADSLGVRWIERLATWELVHPRCAREREDDLLEVEEMLAAGEVEVARDELRYLLGDCANFLAAHQKLGEIAFEEQEWALARAHFGHVFHSAAKALPPQAAAGPLLYGLASNQPPHESGKGLAWSLHKLGRDELSREVLEQLLAWDASDPLNVRPWLTAWPA